MDSSISETALQTSFKISSFIGEVASFAEKTNCFF
jgi:hypothetical protein